MKVLTCYAACLACGLAHAAQTQAQPYPAKPIRLTERVRALATTGAKRSPALPEIPTGAEVVAGTPEQFRAHLKSELAKFGKLVKAAGIKAAAGG